MVSLVLGAAKAKSNVHSRCARRAFTGGVFSCIINPRKCHFVDVRTVVDGWCLCSWTTNDYAFTPWQFHIHSAAISDCQARVCLNSSRLRNNLSVMPPTVEPNEMHIPEGFDSQRRYLHKHRHALSRPTSPAILGSSISSVTYLSMAHYLQTTPPTEPPETPAIPLVLPIPAPLSSCISMAAHHHQPCQ